MENAQTGGPPAKIEEGNGDACARCALSSATSSQPPSKGPRAPVIPLRETSGKRSRKLPRSRFTAFNSRDTSCVCLRVVCVAGYLPILIDETSPAPASFHEFIRFNKHPSRSVRRPVPRLKNATNPTEEGGLRRPFARRKKARNRKNRCWGFKTPISQKPAVRFHQGTHAAFPKSPTPHTPAIPCPAVPSSPP